VTVEYKTRGSGELTTAETVTHLVQDHGMNPLDPRMTMPFTIHLMLHQQGLLPPDHNHGERF